MEPRKIKPVLIMIKDAEHMYGLKRGHINYLRKTYPDFEEKCVKKVGARKVLLNCKELERWIDERSKK